MDSWLRFLLRKHLERIKGILRIPVWLIVLTVSLLLLATLIWTIGLTLDGLRSGDIQLVTSAGTAAGAIATIILVAITIGYARQTKQMVQAMRVEQRREQIVKLIHIIDNILKELEGQKSKIEEARDSSGTRFKYPQLNLVIHLSVSRKDILNAFPAAGRVMNQWVNSTEEYHEAFMNLREEITEFIEDGFRPDELAHRIDQAVPDEIQSNQINVEWANTDNPNVVFEERASEFAYCVISDHPEVDDHANQRLSKNDIVHMIYYKYRDDFLRLRGLEEFSTQFSHLDELLNDVEYWIPKAGEALEWVRPRWVDEYKITETEIQDHNTQRAIGGLKNS